MFQNDIQAVDFDRSTFVKFADDLTLSVSVKGTQDLTPWEVENIISWAQNNFMTINLTTTKEMVFKGKVEKHLPTTTFDTCELNRKHFLSFRAFTFFVTLEVGTSKSIPFLAKQPEGVCTYQ